MDDELTVLQKRNTKFNFYIRITEAVLCALCLIAFLVIFFRLSPLLYVTIIILIVAALSLLLVFISLVNLLKLRKENKENFDKRWIYAALILTILNFLAMALLILQLMSLSQLLLILTAVLAALTALVFLVDFLYNFCFALLPKHAPHTRRNQVQPENTVPDKDKEVYGMVECSVIVGDQLACNQQLCHVKWSGDQTSSSPTAKLIYVQPCNSSIVNKVCPACKNLNCEKCFKTDNNGEKRTSEKISQTDFKSTQFPETDEKICPLCSFKAVKAFKSVYVQTSDFSIQTASCCKEMPEEKSTRDDLSQRTRFLVNPKLSQSSPVSPRKSSNMMICPKCRRRSSWFTKKSTHLCPLCNQQCSSKATCTTCYFTLTPPAVPPEPPKRRRSTNIPRIKRTSKNIWKNRYRKESKKRLSDDESESSAEQYYNANEKVQVERRRSENRNKVVQVSSKDFFIDDEPSKKRDCCVKSDCRGKPEDFEIRNISSRELLDEMRAIMIMDRSTVQIYKNRAYNNRYSVNQSMLGESTQVSSEDFLEQTARKEDKLTQVSVSNFSEAIAKQEDKQTQVSITSGPEKEMDSSFDDKKSVVSKYDYVQKERRPCGAPNCQHPRCGKANQTDDEDTGKSEIIQTTPLTGTESPKVDEETMTVGNTCCQTNISIEVNKEISCQTGASLEEIKEMSCLTQRSLKDRTYEEIISVSKEEREEMEKEEQAGCTDPTCRCIITEKEILVCMYCQSLLNKSKEMNSGISGDEETQTGCTCNLPTCICCKVPRETDEEICSGTETMKEREISPRCFCIKTPTGLIKCTLCESIKKAEAEAIDKDALILPTCSSSVSTCPNYRPRNPELDDPNKKRRVILQSREQSTSTPTSTKSSFQKTSAKSSKRGLSMEEQKHKSNKHEKETSDEKEVTEDEYDYETTSTETEAEIKFLKEKRPIIESEKKPKTFDKRATLSEIQEFYKEELENMSRYLANKQGITFQVPKSESTSNIIEAPEVDDLKNTMKVEWETLVAKRATHQTRVEREAESNITFDEGSQRLLEKTQFEMQNIYNSMIRNLLERNTKKEQDIIFLERMKCGCGTGANCIKHRDCCKEEDVHQTMQFYQLIDCPKLLAKTTKSEETTKEETVFDIKEICIAPSSSDIVISETVSLSTITEEISGTPSELISISKESEPSISKELLEEDKDKQEKSKVYEEKPDLTRRCNNYRPPETCFVVPHCQQINQGKKEADKTPIKISPKPSCSTSPSKPARKSAGFFDPVIFSPTHDSTKTSLTVSDDSTIDLNQRENTRAFSSSSEENPAPISRSVPLTSRCKLPGTRKDRETKRVFYCGYSIPCTPKKTLWLNPKSDSLTDVSETSPKKVYIEPFRKESDYDEGNDSSSMVVIKSFYPEFYESENMETKIVPPLPIENLTPEFSETETISCSPTARTLQAIDNYNLEFGNSSKKKLKHTKLQEKKQSKKTVKSQPQSKRTHSIVDKSQRKQIVKFSVEPASRERHISAPLRTSQRKKSSSSPRVVKSKSATTHTYHQKTIASSLKTTDKKKTLKVKSESEQDQVCSCELYKKSKTNHCRVHGTVPHPTVHTVVVTRTPKGKDKKGQHSKKGSPKDTARTETGTGRREEEKEDKSSDEENVT